MGQPQATLHAVCEFLGVESAFEFTELDQLVNAPRVSAFGLRLVHLLPVNNHLALRFISRLEQRLGWGGEKKRPNAQTLERLYALYVPENEKLFRLLGREVNSWRRDHAYITR